jgi:hypothetical protein
MLSNVKHISVAVLAAAGLFAIGFAPTASANPVAVAAAVDVESRQLAAFPILHAILTYLEIGLVEWAKREPKPWGTSSKAGSWLKHSLTRT